MREMEREGGREGGRRWGGAAETHTEHRRAAVRRLCCHLQPPPPAPAHRDGQHRGSCAPTFLLRVSPHHRHLQQPVTDTPHRSAAAGAGAEQSSSRVWPSRVRFSRAPPQATRGGRQRESGASPVALRASCHLRSPARLLTPGDSCWGPRWDLPAHTQAD